MRRVDGQWLTEQEYLDVQLLRSKQEFRQAKIEEGNAKRLLDYGLLWLQFAYFIDRDGDDAPVSDVAIEQFACDLYQFASTSDQQPIKEQLWATEWFYADYLRCKEQVTAAAIGLAQAKKALRVYKERQDTMADLRMFTLNHVLLTGRLTRDPELRYTGNGNAVCNLAVAMSNKFKDSSGTTQEKTVFIDITVWQKSGEWCGANLHKGSPVCIEGRLTQESWEKDGQKRSKITVTATSVHSMAWENQDDAKQEAPVASDDDIPF